MSVSVDSHFDGTTPQVRTTYNRLMDALRQFGDVKEAPKQTSIHLENDSGFAGVYTRKGYILLHFRTDYKIDDSRITKCEQLSARRFKHTVKLEGETDVDTQLLNWLKDAYKIAGTSA